MAERAYRMERVAVNDRETTYRVSRERVCRLRLHVHEKNRFTHYTLHVWDDGTVHDLSREQAVEFGRVWRQEYRKSIMSALYIEGIR